MLAKLDTKSQLVQEPSLSSAREKNNKMASSVQSKVQKETAAHAEEGGSSKKLPPDRNKMKRLVNNRVSSQRCRIKRELKRMELEEKCSQLMLETQKYPVMIDYYTRQQTQLKEENEKLKQSIANVNLKLFYGEMTADYLKKEIQDLRMLYEAKVAEVQLEQQLQTQNLQYDLLAAANNFNIFFG
uniref:BZIP domain-containing protein n=1 Tax=Ananas comosus var. bracteatus TaxID=296719 RepID=A0A6V7NG07_ANACO|nr:unnamed protein product [Ananas comosus var. bracteatus]